MAVRFTRGFSFLVLFFSLSGGSLQCGVFLRRGVWEEARLRRPLHLTTPRSSMMRGRGEPAVVSWQASPSSPTSRSSYSSLFSPIDFSPVRAYTSPTIDNFEFNHTLIAIFETLSVPLLSCLLFKLKLLEAPVIVLLCLFPTMNSTGRTLMAQFRIQLSALILFPFTPPHVHQLAFSHLNALITKPNTHSLCQTVHPLPSLLALIPSLHSLFDQLYIFKFILKSSVYLIMHRLTRLMFATLLYLLFFYSTGSSLRVSPCP